MWRNTTMCVLLAATCAAGPSVRGASVDRQRHSSANPADLSLKKFLQTYLDTSKFSDDRSTRYSPALVDLDADSVAEAVVYVSGGGWCGSGGCLLLVLKSKGTSYEVVGRTAIERPPIRVLATKTNGWRDIGVWVVGGGVHPGHEAQLSFDVHPIRETRLLPPPHEPLRKLQEKS